MKANQAFVNNEEAVSPVIGVILMVAITVVLAAVVFVLVSDLGGGSDSAPAMSFEKDEGADRLEVISAEGDADWSRIEARVVSCTQTAAVDAGDGAVVRVGDATPTNGAVNENAIATGEPMNVANDAAAATTCGAPVAVRLADAVDAMTAGEFVDFCATTDLATGPTNVVIQLVDTTANQQVYEATFASIAKC